MAIYNVTNLTNANDLLEFTQVINQFSEGLFGIMLYITVLVIIFGTIRMSSQTIETSKVLAGTLWFGAIFSILLLRMEMVAALFAIASFTLSMIFTVVIYLTRTRQS